MAEDQPAETIARAVTRTRAVGGARFELQIGERPLPWSPDRSTDVVRHPMRGFARWMVGRWFAARSMKGVIDLRARRYMLFGAYAQLYADGQLWGGAPGRSLSTLSAHGEADAAPLWLWELLDAIDDASEVECQQVRDARCRHFTASLDGRDASQTLPSRWSGGGEARQPEIWIDENDHIRRIRVHAEERSQTIELWDLGARVDELDWTRLPDRHASDEA